MVSAIAIWCSGCGQENTGDGDWVWVGWRSQLDGWNGWIAGDDVADGIKTAIALVQDPVGVYDVLMGEGRSVA
jgi:hypothetical protein